MSLRQVHETTSSKASIQLTEFPCKPKASKRSGEQVPISVLCMEATWAGVNGAPATMSLDSRDYCTVSPTRQNQDRLGRRPLGISGAA